LQEEEVAPDGEGGTTTTMVVEAEEEAEAETIEPDLLRRDSPRNWTAIYLISGKDRPPIL
jgi:hypothetical protein